MKSSILVTLFVAFVATANAQSKKIALPLFMLGKWEMSIAKGKITESWEKTKDGMAGKSYRHKLNGDSSLTESVDIKIIDNTWNYCVTAHEKGNEGKTNFKLVSFSDGTYIFENKQHDFPQRVIYQDKGKDALLAWIEGEIQGKTKKSEYPYHRRK
jgi:hypothetical protein